MEGDRIVGGQMQLIIGEIAFRRLICTVGELQRMAVFCAGSNMKSTLRANP